jgi:cysteinyl-tRNA synthetase
MRILLLSVALLAACGKPSVEPRDCQDCGGNPAPKADASSIADAGAVLDAGAASDAGAGADAASPSDGGLAPDAGARPDAGSPQDGGSGRGFPALAPWVSYYGTAKNLDIAKAAATFRILNIDADPDVGAMSPSDIATLKASGKNRVISYLNLGSCEEFRSYWKSAPAGLVPCEKNTAAKIGPYDGYPDETWMNVGEPQYQRLLLEHVAQRIADTGVDGFFLDNMEIVEHGTATTNGPCDAACSQGGLDLVRKLRERFPEKLIVLQNGTSDVTRLGKTGGVAFPSLLDGLSHESIFAPSPGDPSAEAELVAWKGMNLSPGGRPFFIGTEDYVGSCNNTLEARAVYAKSRANGFSPYAVDKSAGQQVVCYWGF